ncbi:MAG: 6-phosphofructokinase [Clostridiales bacterium]|nr:6-phosphofructokinase [Clostridiales bacterium]MDY3748035.1 6-phosphofructokinase [Lachnospiraceae bacterium]
MKKIGVLTSGGDSPGMNAAIRAVVRTALKKGMQPIGFIKGYNGLLYENYMEMDWSSVSNIIQRGGTVLKTARCKEFYEPEYRQKAYENAKAMGLDGLVVIGGDGSYRGAGYLSELGLPCIGIPGTIDNDIACTDYTIGYDTAMNTVVECVDKLNDTSQSHERCSVIEVMGRHAGYIALNTGIATGAVQIMTEEIPVTVEQVAENIERTRGYGKDHFIVIVSEGFGNPNEVALKIQEITGIDSRATILGHIQRGGNPTLRDRVVATIMGNYAVNLLEAGKTNRVIAMKDHHYVDYDIQEALAMKKGLNMQFYDAMLDVSC